MATDDIMEILKLNLANVNKIRIRCKRMMKVGDVEGSCNGQLEMTPDELSKLKFGTKCPRCAKEFSSGRKFMLSGDQIQVIGDFFRILKNQTDFEVELL